MTSARRPLALIDSALVTSAVDTVERRARICHEHELLQAERQRRLLELSAAATPPEDRIRLWERLHALNLPRAPAHKLVRIIASQTGLTILQVHEEQTRRIHPVVPLSSAP